MSFRNILENNYVGQNILVTGASGYIGNSLINILASRFCRILAISRNPKFECTPQGKASIRTKTGSISEVSFWQSTLEAFKPNIIFHLAAQNSVYESENNIEFDYQSNVAPLKAILEACENLGEKPMVVFAGTATQLGFAQNLPVDETAPDNPITVYDQHKLEAEKLLEVAVSNGICQGCTLRLSNVYGEGKNVSSSDRGVLNKMIVKAYEGKPLMMFGSGENLRDYIHIRDVVKAFLLTGIRKNNVNGRYFYLGSGQGHTIKQAFTMIAEMAEELIGRTIEVRSIRWPEHISPIEKRDFIANISALEKALGWRPEVNLWDGIKSTFDEIVLTKNITQNLGKVF